MIPGTAPGLHWASSTLLAAAPWVWLWRPGWAPLVLALAVVLRLPWQRRHPAGPWAAAGVAASSLAALAAQAGWGVGAAWLGLGGLVALVAWSAPQWPGRRPDAADLVALVGWGGAFAAHPSLLEASGGGWLAPAVLLVTASSVRRRAPVAAEAIVRPAPPDVEVRGELTLDRAVLTGDDGTPCSAPLSLDLAPGESVAVVCDSAAEAQALVLTLAGRRQTLSGSVTVDGRPASAGVATLVALGEPFVPGDLEQNLEALTGEPLSEGVRVAVYEACALGEVASALGERELDEDGRPLSVFHRLLVLTARVIPSHYRLLVVVDPMPWVNAVRGELWRAAVVRASVGRTSVWVTHDRELASRADTMLEFRHGALLPVR